MNKAKKNEREAQQANAYTPKIPPSLSKFKQPEQEELRLLKKQALPLHRYYEQEVQQYFERLNPPKGALTESE